MITTYKFSSKDTKLLFFSDLHYNHNPQTWTSPKPYESRGFTSIEDFNQWFYKKWYELVDENTIVFDLGDTHFKDPRCLEFERFSRLPCKEHYLVWGNHFSGAKQTYIQEVKKQYNIENKHVYPLKYNNITFVGDTLSCFIDSKAVFMQHFAPYIWPEIHKGGYALCGHSHGNCKEINIKPSALGRILDIGMDNAIKYNKSPFFSWQEIQKILDSKEINKKDHH
jgi:calcineurin-like phosphoesterase family protein